jgi:hypothetical protein
MLRDESSSMASQENAHRQRPRFKGILILPLLMLTFVLVRRLNSEDRGLGQRRQLVRHEMPIRKTSQWNNFMGGG